MVIITGTFDEERAAIEKRLDQILAAVRTKDFDRLAGYHLESPKFSKFDDFEPLDRQDIEAANRAEAEGLGVVENFQCRLKIHIFGPVAIADAPLRERRERLEDRARASLTIQVEPVGTR